MKLGLPALLLLLASGAGAQGFVSMGRLFTTPVERAQLDAQRSQAVAAGGVPQNGAPHVSGIGGTQPPGGGALAPGMDTSAGCPPGSAPGCPPTAAAAQGAAGVDAAPGTGGPAGTQGEPEPAGLRLGGVIRRANGPAMIILNGEAQPAPPGSVMRGSVTLQADGRSVVLKPGQRYDPATGEVHEAAR